jgi:N utilization substance protein B
MKLNAAARGRARRITMQALYQWHITGNDSSIIIAACHSENDMENVDTEYFSELFRGTVAVCSELDKAFTPYIVGLTFEKLDPISLALLRMATYELRERIDVPYRVVINEALNLAKKYGAEDSHKFLNGVLDKVAAQLRDAEMSADKRKK